jgi:hypothetical protein
LLEKHRYLDIRIIYSKNLYVYCKLHDIFARKKRVLKKYVFIFQP